MADSVAVWLLDSAPALRWQVERDLLGESAGAWEAPHGGWVSRFGYPFRWEYNVLNAADYFRLATAVDDVTPDPRMTEAIEIIRAARQPDGAWTTAGRKRRATARTVGPKSPPARHRVW